MMKRMIIAAIIFLIAASFAKEPPKITIFMAGDSTMAVKDASAFPETGWGMPFVHFWDSTVVIVNKAKNGRSTRTFISEGLWKSIADNIKEGDYVLIQFGHNDESKEKVDRYTTPEEFTRNLTIFITESREKGATPVLFTPVSRRRFDSAGTALETHQLYSQLTREVAQKTGTILIDLDKKSRDLYQSFGAENSRLLFLQLTAGEHPNYPEGKNDNTHFNELGARLIAQLVLREMRSQLPELNGRIVISKKK